MMFQMRWKSKHIYIIESNLFVLMNYTHSIVILDHVTATTHIGGGEHILVQVVSFQDAYPTSTVHRLETLEMLAGSQDLVNLALADPTTLRLNKDSSHICSKSSGLPQFFFLVGMCTYSSTTSGDFNRQICVAPSSYTWPRAAAVIGKVIGCNTFQVPSFRRGSSFSTYRKPANLSGQGSYANSNAIAPGTPVKTKFKGRPPRTYTSSSW